ncbi:aquaporin [Mycobacterium sp. MS1601]|uniref:MIP/aquaporin family protein n=1 Tax=Mycobacterium sp. MS1601 TaxID=1936029 RepID=UPI0009793D01|nr:MIP/aquaporin family protein [Mycobacterium sp. MS1601]AQA04363.1 aquaporin [Mycobacterium sp. MS1601]
MEFDLRRRVAAEFIGTALLVIFGPGSVVAALVAQEGEIDYPSVGFISLSFGIVVAAVIYGFGTVSGAHINPAVTFALAVIKRFSWAEVAPYVLAQLAGAVGGALLVVAMFGSRAAELGLIGATTLGDGVSISAGILAEVVGTFLLMFTIMAVAVNPRAPAGWAGLMIGLSVVGAILVMAPLTGASFNPARTFGPYLVSGFVGAAPPWSELVVYIIGPLVGATVAAVVYTLVALPRAPAPNAASVD